MGKRQTIAFGAGAAAAQQGATRFGGQPDWIDPPQWPLSRESGKPMRFICQVALDRTLFPGARGKLAYVFMTDEDDDYVDGTWEPEGGENCVIIQPGGAAPLVETASQATGPTLYALRGDGDSDGLARVEGEYAVSLKLEEEPDYCPEDARAAWSDDAFDRYAEALDENKIGGAPIFLQGDEFPEGEGWRLLLQLDSTRVPFFVNFGDAGIAYAFINSEGSEGRLLWQCS